MAKSAPKQVDIASAIHSAQRAAIREECNRVIQLAKQDRQSSISSSLASAIMAGTSVQDFALQQARRSTGQQLGGGPRHAPASSKKGGPSNRGKAAVERLRGKHPGLPR